MAKLRASDSYFVQIDIQFATEYGLDEAVLAGKLLRLQETLKGATDDNGNKWVRLTLEEWTKELPFMDDMKIRRTIGNLEKKNIFLSTTFTGRSKWYRVNPDYIEVDNKTSVQNEQIHYNNCSKCTDVSVQNEQLPIILPILSNTEEVEEKPQLDSRWEKIWKLWADNIHLSESPIIIEEMKSEIYLSCPYEWWRQAVAIASRNRAFNWSYVRAILNGAIEAKTEPDKVPSKNGRLEKNSGVRRATNGHNTKPAAVIPASSEDQARLKRLAAAIASNDAGRTPPG